MLRGFVLARSLRGKPFTFDLRAARIRLRGPHLGLIEAIAGVVWATLGLAGVASGVVETTLGSIGVVAGVVETALGAATPAWLGGVKQNSSEAKPLSCEHLVGVRRFELLTYFRVREALSP